MNATPPRHLDANALVALSHEADGAPPCDDCGTLAKPGWESMPGSFDRALLTRTGTTRDEGDEDPTLQEYHPHGTHAWSPDAPIALHYFPYNRCDVWQCIRCHRAFLRYTEYGGYYVDERVRPVDPALVVTSQSPAA